MKAESDRNLIDFLTNCDKLEAYIIVKLLRSRLSSHSRNLASRFTDEKDIPETGSTQRTKLAEEITNLLGWYGINEFAHA